MALVGACASFAGCDGTSADSGSNSPTGSLQLVPGSANERYEVSTNEAGESPNFRITAVNWGRLVDIYAPLTAGGTPVRIFKDYLIAADIGTDSDYTLSRELSTGIERLTLSEPYAADPSTGQPSAAFRNLIAPLQGFLQIMLDKSLDPSELPPFTSVPRNGAVAITLNDLIDATTITETTVQLKIGYPPTTLQPARIIADPSLGDMVGGVYFTSRILVDFTVSPFEASSTNPVLPVNSLGLPEAQNTAQPNIALRIPTRTVPGTQFQVLRNKGGTALSFNGNGSTDPFSSSLDVVRAFRSGGRTTVTQDPFNGFLQDTLPPQLFSAQKVSVSPTAQVGANVTATITFATAACAVQPRIGDVVEISGQLAEVYETGATPSAGVVSNVRLRLVTSATNPPLVQPTQSGEFRTPWQRTIDQINRPECWIKVEPAPLSGVGTGISTNSTFSLLFSEPMDPTRLNAFDTFQLLYGIATPSLQGQVVAQVVPTGDLTRFLLQPARRLRHAASQSETYRVSLPTGTQGPVDLAGNALSFRLTDGSDNPPDFTVRSTDTAIESRSVMLKFQATDENPSDTPVGPEVRGQLIYDLLNGRVRPRSVTRISAACDTTTPMIATDLLVAGAGVQTRLPFVPQGCRMMTLWRHADLGFDVLGDGFHNLDVEGLNWAPSNSGLQIDTMPLFQMGIAHSKRLPDELLDPMTGQPLYPNSGILDVFDDNLLDPVNDPLSIISPKEDGYFIQPSDVFQAASGTPMAPWPMNQGRAVEDFTYYTWRDTSLLAVGQPNTGPGTGQGVKLGNELAYDTTPPNAAYGLGFVPTIGLPLLMDFRVYPSSQILGANQLTGLFAIATNPPSPTEIAPFWTALTAGGVLASTGIPSVVDPDAEASARGLLTGGGAVGTLPRNQFIFFGQGDFVVRVNRAHTRWFECAPTAPGLPFDFAEPVVEPSIDRLPPGTQLLVQYRGATAMNSTGTRPWEDAGQLDPYGNPRPGGTAFTVTFTGGSNTWKDTMAAINGSQFFQARITMVSNPVSGATPELSSLGFAFVRQQ